MEQKADKHLSRVRVQIKLNDPNKASNIYKQMIAIELVKMS